jgi:hypothetical protein
MILGFVAYAYLCVQGQKLRRFAAAGDAFQVLTMLRDPSMNQAIINSKGSDSGKTALHRALEAVLALPGDRSDDPQYFARSADDPRGVAIQDFILRGISSPLLDSVNPVEIQIKSFAAICAALVAKGADVDLPDSMGVSAQNLAARLPYTVGLRVVDSSAMPRP